MAAENTMTNGELSAGHHDEPSGSQRVAAGTPAAAPENLLHTNSRVPVQTSDTPGNQQSVLFLTSPPGDFDACLILTAPFYGYLSHALSKEKTKCVSPIGLILGESTLNEA